MTDALDAFLAATVRTATPLALAALGETVAERAGVINVGLEGILIAGCLGAAVGGRTGDVGLGIAAGAAAGLATALVFALFAVWWRTDQIITGTALTMGALGLTGALYRSLFGTEGAALGIATLPVIAVPGLSRLPLVGAAFFQQTVATYAVYAALPLAWWGLARTQAGLALRAVGEHPEAAAAAGIHPRRVQGVAVAVCGVLGGAAGASLVLAQVGTFTEGMSAGRGFIAIAIVALGRWSPLGVGAAALLFGAATALQYLFQSSGSMLPYQLFLAVPYALTLAVMVAGTGRGRAPAALGRRDLDAH